MKYKRISFEDDIVIVKCDGKEIYKGTEDFEPMKNEDWVWDRVESCYVLRTPEHTFKKYCIEM